MKIAYLSPTGALGGAELCLLDLLASARNLYPEWELCVLLGGDGSLRTEVEALGVACTILPLPARVARLGDSGLRDRSAFSRFFQLGVGGLSALAGTVAYRRQLSQWLRSAAPDVVQTNGMKMHLLASWSARPGLKVVWHLHDFLGSRPAMARLLRLSRRRGLEGVAVSRSVADDAQDVLGSSVPVQTVLNRIDLDRFHDGPNEGEALDQRGKVTPAPPGTVRVGLVATFAVWKGHALFLEAISRIPEGRPARFYIVGGPIYQSAGSQLTFEALREKAAALGVSDRVVFTGHCEDPAAAIRGLDVVVHASTQPEPFGRVIVEGMACGRAVVAIRAGGSAELFEDGKSALGSALNNADELAAAIDRLILDPELRAQLGREGKRTTAERFDRTRLAEEWASIYANAGSTKPVLSTQRPLAEPSGTRSYQ